MGKLFCVTLRDYASNEQKVREAIQELEVMFPPPKAEEGLSSQFQQIDRNNGYGGNQYGGNQGFINDDQEDKKNAKAKAKKAAAAVPKTDKVVTTKIAKG